ncbi:MAG: hypothetical protein HBSAPP02_27560 [Phycisphaerae bacterium]|nr:MAG: hypothetical protein HBSAPP02_27560 [Phycisphaerae bacterium]
MRGGSFNNNDNNLHASNRNNNNPTNENNNIGFRVSEAPETQAAQACGLIRAGGQSSPGRAVLRDHPVVRRARCNRAKPWPSMGEAGRRRRRPGRGE